MSPPLREQLRTAVRRCGPSLAEKIAQWRVLPMTSLQLVTNVLMPSQLTVGAASMV
jgi:hypothetical protein